MEEAGIERNSYSYEICALIHWAIHALCGEVYSNLCLCENVLCIIIIKILNKFSRIDEARTMAHFKNYQLGVYELLVVKKWCIRSYLCLFGCCWLLLVDRGRCGK